MSIPERVAVLENDNEHMEKEMMELRQEFSAMQARMDESIEKIREDIAIKSRAVRGIFLLLSIFYVLFTLDGEAARSYAKSLLLLLKLGG